MTDREDQRSRRLEAVHVCERCGAKATPTQVKDEVNVTGVVQCNTCSHVGPLRIQIVDSDAS
jgi:DNA-directed RNA polymerase subunit RPC12/RpoP